LATLGAVPVCRLHVKLKPEGSPKRYRDDFERSAYENAEARGHVIYASIANTPPGTREYRSRPKGYTEAVGRIVSTFEGDPSAPMVPRFST
jgi:hypothetical protein